MTCCKRIKRSVSRNVLKWQRAASHEWIKIHMAWNDKEWNVSNVLTKKANNENEKKREKRVIAFEITKKANNENEKKREKRVIAFEITKKAISWNNKECHLTKCYPGK